MVVVRCSDCLTSVNRLAFLCPPPPSACLAAASVCLIPILLLKKKRLSVVLLWHAFVYLLLLSWPWWAQLLPQAAPRATELAKNGGNAELDASQLEGQPETHLDRPGCSGGNHHHWPWIH